MYIRMIYHMPKAIGWHGDSPKIVKIFAILKKIPFWTETSKFMRSRISKKYFPMPEIFEFHFEN